MISRSRLVLGEDCGTSLEGVPLRVTETDQSRMELTHSKG